MATSAEPRSDKHVAVTREAPEEVKWKSKDNAKDRFKEVNRGNGRVEGEFTGGSAEAFETAALEAAQKILEEVEGGASSATWLLHRLAEPGRIPDHLWPFAPHQRSRSRSAHRAPRGEVSELWFRKHRDVFGTAGGEGDGSVMQVWLRRGISETAVHPANADPAAVHRATCDVDCQEDEEVETEDEEWLADEQRALNVSDDWWDGDDEKNEEQEEESEQEDEEGGWDEEGKELIGRFKKWFPKAKHAFGYIACLDVVDDVFVYGHDLVKSLGLNNFEVVPQYVGRFLRFRAVKNERGVKALGPMTLLPSDFDGEKELKRALNHQRTEKLNHILGEHEVQRRKHEQRQRDKEYKAYVSRRWPGGEKTRKRLNIILHCPPKGVVIPSRSFVIRAFPPVRGMQLFRLKEPVTYTCAIRRVRVKTSLVAIVKGQWVSNGAYGGLVSTNRDPKSARGKGSQRGKGGKGGKGGQSKNGGYGTKGSHKGTAAAKGGKGSG